MELVDYLRMLRRQWVWVVGSVVVLTALAAVYVVTAPKTYKATADLYVGSTVVGANPGDTGSAVQASNYVFDRIDTYAALADQPGVLQPVIKTLKLSTTTSDLAKQVSATVVPSTVIISVSAIDASPSQAQAIANETAKSLSRYLVTLDQPVPDSPSVLDPSVSQEAVLPTSPDSPNRVLMLALGVLVGLALGLVLASLRDQARRTRPARAAERPAADEPAAVLDQPEAPPVPKTSTKPAPRPESKPEPKPESKPEPKPSSLEAALSSTRAREASRPKSVDVPATQDPETPVRTAPESASPAGSRPAGR